MKIFRARHCHDSAFTLLELLIAVAVFAIVLAAINSVFYGAMRLRNKTTFAIERSVEVERALTIIQRDLDNLVPSGGTMSGELQTTAVNKNFPGQASPAFYTASASVDENSPWAEVQKVSFGLANAGPGNGGRDLYRSVTRNLLPNNQEESIPEFLLSGVQSIAFLFFDGTQWRTAWDSTTEETKMPKAIKFQLLLASVDGESRRGSPIELVSPVFVQAKTNSATTTGTSR